jgi:hypothetical protein
LKRAEPVTLVRSPMLTNWAVEVVVKSVPNRHPSESWDLSGNTARACRTRPQLSLG